MFEIRFEFGDLQLSWGNANTNAGSGELGLGIYS